MQSLVSRALKSCIFLTESKKLADIGGEPRSTRETVMIIIFLVYLYEISISLHIHRDSQSKLPRIATVLAS